MLTRIAVGLACLVLLDHLASRLGADAASRATVLAIALGCVYFQRHLASGLETTLFAALLLGLLAALPGDATAPPRR